VKPLFVEEGLTVRKLRPLLLFSLVLAAVLIPSSGHAADPVLNAKVGPGFSIAMTDSNGVKITHIDAGTYTINVQDLSAEHNFDLFGPGSVQMATDVAGTGSTTWTVTFTDGIYNYHCDAHPGQMKGAFAVGTASLPPPPAPKPKPKNLSGKVGPGKTISLKTASGAAVKKLAAGRYRLSVNDITKADNFHLVGPGANKKTGVKFRGTATWTVVLQKGKTYTVRSDATTKLRKTFKVS
jgi:hypothetical protein